MDDLKMQIDDIRSLIEKGNNLLALKKLKEIIKKNIQIY